MSTPRPFGRRGMTILVVLALLSITLAFSYAMLRMQFTATQVQTNAGRNLDARQAALAGMSVALQKMSAADWAGVDMPLAGAIASNLSYNVTFTTGDASLLSTSPDYAEWPFRVTIVSTGIATDPTNLANSTTYKVQAVVQLIRRSLTTPPTAWTNLQTYTLYQWGSSRVTMELPSRIEGKVRIQGELDLAPSYPMSAARIEYFGDYSPMMLAGFGDHRPFTGTIEWKQSSQSSTVRSLISSTLTATSNISISSYSAPITHPGSVQTYRLYPGGKQYTVPLLEGDSNSRVTGTFEPDVTTNPLGVLRTNGLIRLGNGTVIRGTVITSGSDPDIDIDGTAVRLEGVDLPELYNATSTTQLPVATVADDVRVRDSCSQLTVKGAVISWGTFDVDPGGTVNHDLQGRLFTQKLVLDGRTGWNASQWSDWLTLFTTQVSTGIAYFPVWVEQKKGLPVKAQISLKPLSNQSFHWPDWSQPIYQPHPNDGGLRWDVVAWKELQ